MIAMIIIISHIPIPNSAALSQLEVEKNFIKKLDNLVFMIIKRSPEGLSMLQGHYLSVGRLVRTG